MGGLNEKEDEYIKLVHSYISAWFASNLLTSSSKIRTLGAKEIVPREGFQGDPRYLCFCILALWDISAPFQKFLNFGWFLLRPLGKELYAGAVDACGGKVLANILPLVGKHHYFHLNVPFFPVVSSSLVNFTCFTHASANHHPCPQGSLFFGLKTILKNIQIIEMIFI